MIDLSTLTIPPADVVPEPTAAQWEWFKDTLPHMKSNSLVHAGWTLLAVSLARRCRELEAEVADLKGIVGQFDPGFVGEFITTLAGEREAYRQLEFEIERLRKGKDEFYGGGGNYQ